MSVNTTTAMNRGRRDSGQSPQESNRHRPVPGFSYPMVTGGGMVWTGEDGRHRIQRQFLSQQIPARSIYTLWRDEAPLVTVNVQYTSPKQHSAAMEFLARMAKI